MKCRLQNRPSGLIIESNRQIDLDQELKIFRQETFGKFNHLGILDHP